MNELPALIQRSPTILYVTALFFFLASFGLAMAELHQARHLVEGEGALIRLTMLKALYDALREAVYIAANGVIAHILLAIWANGRVTAVAGSAQ